MTTTTKAMAIVGQLLVDAETSFTVDEEFVAQIGVSKVAAVDFLFNNDVSWSNFLSSIKTQARNKKNLSPKQVAGVLNSYMSQLKREMSQARDRIPTTTPPASKPVLSPPAGENHPVIKKLTTKRVSTPDTSRTRRGKRDSSSWAPIQEEPEKIAQWFQDWQRQDNINFFLNPDAIHKAEMNRAGVELEEDDDPLFD